MPSIPFFRGRISSRTDCKQPNRRTRAGMFAHSAARAATSPTSSLSDNRPAALNSTSKPARLRADRQWARVSKSDVLPFTQQTVSASSADAVSRRTVPGVTPGIRRPSRARSVETEYICPHDDCSRVFRRKTSLTNHVKAHSNANSRSILRTKRLRKQMKLAQINAQKASERQSNAIRNRAQEQQASSRKTLDENFRLQQHGNQQQDQQTLQPTPHAHQKQHQIEQRTCHLDLQHIALTPELTAFSTRPTSLPWSALTGSPHDEADAGYCGHGAREPQADVEVLSTVAEQVADLKLEAQLAQFIPHASHPETFQIDDAELCQPIISPWNGVGAESIAISTPMFAGFDHVLPGYESSAPFGVFQGDFNMPLERDLSFQHHLEALTSFVLPENGTV